MHRRDWLLLAAAAALSVLTLLAVVALVPSGPDPTDHDAPGCGWSRP